MKSRAAKWLVFALMILFAAGCEVTAEKINLWKGTQNGPKKLAATVIDRDVQTELRAKAVVALVEIPNWELFREVFKKMEKADAEQVINQVVPLLAKSVKGGGPGVRPTEQQVDAKDALFVLLDYAGGEGKTAAERALIGWCSADFNIRAMAGDHPSTAIVRKIGPAAADALVPLLAIDQPVIKHAADLIREVDNPVVMEKASKKLASELRNNIAKIQEIHLVAAAVIGGDAVGSALLDLATDTKVSPELQRFALRAYSESMNKKSIVLNDEHVAKLFAMAENTAYDQYQREETYYVIAQGGRKQDLPGLRKLLENESSFFRAVGLRCVLRVAPEEELAPALDVLARITTEPDDVVEVISRVSSFPNLLPKIRELVDSPSVFSRAVALGALGAIGKAEDIAKIEALKGNRTAVPKGFGQKNLGEAAAAAVESIKKRGA